MSRRRIAAAAALALGVASPALAERVVDYAIDEAQAARDAAEQGVPLAPLPGHGRDHIAVRLSPDLDHEVIRAGIYCSNWKVRNPVSVIVGRFLTSWDRDGAPAATSGPGVDLLVTVDRASTLSRCVGSGELKSVCITRISLHGTTLRPGASPEAFHIEREAAAHGVGLCAGLTRGIGLVGRAAAADLVVQLANRARTAA